MTIDKHNWRVWIAGWRIHHGAVGIAAIAFGAMLAAHDWADRKRWFTGR